LEKLFTFAAEMKDIGKYFFALLGLILLNISILTAERNPQPEARDYDTLPSETERNDATLSICKSHSCPFFAEECTPFSAPARVTDTQRQTVRIPARLVRFGLSFGKIFMLHSDLTGSLSGVFFRVKYLKSYLSLCPASCYYVFMLREIII
jgi:hypothetical protein